MLRTAAFVVVTLGLIVASVVRVAAWATADHPTRIAHPPSSTALPAIATPDTTPEPTFVPGTVVKARRRPAPTTTVRPVPRRSWTWDELAACESSNRWSVVREPYQGGLQFHSRTWDRYAPAGYPEEANLASRAQQIAVAEKVLAAEGVKAWPTCGPRIGMTARPATGD